MWPELPAPDSVELHALGPPPEALGTWSELLPPGPLGAGFSAGKVQEGFVGAGCVPPHSCVCLWGLSYFIALTGKKKGHSFCPFSFFPF